MRFALKDSDDFKRVQRQKRNRHKKERRKEKRREWTKQHSRPSASAAAPEPREEKNEASVTDVLKAISGRRRKGRRV
ncbi:MAG: hypothetical protein IKH50_03385 [Oscillospiraceae bacterium]|nr:hypothetical protein [Oscillospiraceae bacterium]MBR6923563.1 hypothetical protein [Oscillospiraceae bacterium]